MSLNDLPYASKRTVSLLLDLQIQMIDYKRKLIEVDQLKKDIDSSITRIEKEIKIIELENIE